MQQQNPYNQPPMGQGMLPQPPMPPMPSLQTPKRARSWRERLLGLGSARALTKQQDRTLPSWIVWRSVVAYFVSFLACIMAFGYGMPIEYAVFSVISILLFFYGTGYLSVNWQNKSPRIFEKYLFIWGLVIRLIWVIFSYEIYNPKVYGESYGYGDDIGAYLEVTQDFVHWIQSGFAISYGDYIHGIGLAIDDSGYSIWLAVIYLLTSSDILVPMLLKAVLSAYSCICIYNVAKRHFGEGTARMAGLFMCLNPYMLFWCSSLLKETEMIFLCCVFVDKTDRALRSEQKVTFRGLLPGILAGLALFFFRAPLAIVAYLAIFTHIVFVSRKVMSFGKKIIMALLVGVVLLIGMGDRIRTQSDSLLEQLQSDQQKSNMEWRSQRKDSGGRTQNLAKYAGAAVFAPLIFTIPFPTFNMAAEEQIMQLEMSGANYIKNIFSFFVIYVLIIMVLSGEWRRHVFILVYTLGYHMVLVMSNFAQSGRFHMPVLPMLLLFAAYGIQVAKTNKRIRKWFPIVLVAEVVVCLAWNWFKLAGRGLI